MKVLTVVGARPQFIKAAAVSAAIDRHNASDSETSIDECVVHTGQHYDSQMSDVFFEQLSVRRPTHRLDVGSSSHGAQTGRMLESLETVMQHERPDCVLVYGDTNSTLAGALAAAKLNQPIAHVEAGLRSFNRTMPEEINRVLTDHVSDLLLCPTQRAVDQLEREGITNGVQLCGDVMLDVFLTTSKTIGTDNPVADRLEVRGPYSLVTIHRAANTDDDGRFDAIVGGLSDLAAGGRTIVWPVHPRIAERLTARRLPPGIVLTEPAAYGEFFALLRDAELVLTDSGGLQKEAYWASTPCLTLRDETEWVETIDAGWNRLVPADAATITAAASSVDVPTRHPDLFGRGDSSDLIVSALLVAFG